MPTFNELINGFASKQTYERIQGVVHAALEDVHNHAVRIQTLQSKPGMEGLLALALPKLTKLIEEFSNADADRKKATVESSYTASSSEDVGSISRGIKRYPYSQVPNSGFSPVGPSPAARVLHGLVEGHGGN